MSDQLLLYCLEAVFMINYAEIKFHGPTISALDKL